MLAGTGTVLDAAEAERVGLLDQVLPRPAFDVAKLLFHFGRKGAKNRAVQGRTVRVRWIGVITGLPLGSEQGGKESATLVFEGLELFRGGLSDVRVRFGPPPLLLRGDDLRRAPAGEELVDVGDDDVSNRGFRATDGPEVGDVGRVIGGLDFLPREILPANDHVGLVAPARVNHHRFGALRVMIFHWNGREITEQHRRQGNVQAQRNPQHNSSAHETTVPRTVVYRKSKVSTERCRLSSLLQQQGSLPPSPCLA